MAAPLMQNCLKVIIISIQIQTEKLKFLAAGFFYYCSIRLTLHTFDTSCHHHVSSVPCVTFILNYAYMEWISEYYFHKSSYRTRIIVVCTIMNPSFLIHDLAILVEVSTMIVSVLYLIHALNFFIYIFHHIRSTV